MTVKCHTCDDALPDYCVMVNCEGRGMYQLSDFNIGNKIIKTTVPDRWDITIKEGYALKNVNLI